MYFLLECPHTKLQSGTSMHTDDHSEVLTTLSLFVFTMPEEIRMNIVDILEWCANPKSTPIFQYLWQLETWGGGGMFDSVPVWGPSTMSKTQKYCRVTHRLMVIKNQHQVTHDWSDLTSGFCHVNNLTTGSSLFDMQMCTWLHSFIRLVADYTTCPASSHTHKSTVP